MKNILFIGDSHLARLELAYNQQNRSHSGEYKAHFFCTPGPINNLVCVVDGKLALKKNDHLLKNHPQADKFDFAKWFNDAQEKIDALSKIRSLELNNYFAIVIVSFQFFNPEIWADVAFQHAKGQVSFQLLKQYLEENFELNHARQKSNHFKLLQQIGETSITSSLYSVATPARSETAEFPRNLTSESSHTQLDLFRVVENIYTDIIKSKYESTLIPYPDELLAANGICTSKMFQNSENDYTHINLEGSNIWLEHILRNINQTQ